jgi:6-phosphogluconolactonase
MPLNARRSAGFLCPWLAVLAGVSVSAGIGALQAATDSEPTKVRVYIGTYTKGESKGIYRFDLDLKTGQPSLPEVAAEPINPSFLAIRPNGKSLYCVTEMNSSGTKVGAVDALAIGPASEKLRILNLEQSKGIGPCHVSVDRSGNFLLVANYGSGSIAVLPIGEDGQLGAATAVVQHEGSSVNKTRQDRPHAHSINMDPTNRFALVCDLGLDKVLVYRLDLEKGTLTANDPPFATVAPGSGPRHLTFHPNGEWAYVLNEIASTVTVFQWDAEKGTLSEIQTLSALPDGLTMPENTAAEVQVHPSGKFLYASNRGHDSIAMFAIDAASGRLTSIGHQPSGGETPRNFAIDPTGKWLLEAHQNSGTVSVFAIDEASGKLRPTEYSVVIPSPVCVKFYQPAK